MPIAVGRTVRRPRPGRGAHGQKAWHRDIRDLPCAGRWKAKGVAAEADRKVDVVAGFAVVARVAPVEAAAGSPITNLRK